MSAINLPYPPTTNNLYMNVGKHRIRTKRYDAWLKEGAAMIAQQRPEKVSGPYSLLLRAVRPDRRARDLGNLEKPVSDLLVKCGIVRDDSDACTITMAWVPSNPSGAAVTVEVTETPRDPDFADMPTPALTRILGQVEAILANRSMA